MAPSTRIIPFTRRSSRKLDFRIIINVFNIIIFGLCGASIPYSDEDYIWSRVSIAAPAVSILWTTTCIVLLVKSSLKPRYHPAIDLSFDLVSWLVFWILGAFMIAEVSASEGLIQCSPYYSGVRPISFCANGRTKQWNLDTASGSFMVLTGLIHLVFFAIACQEVKNFRRSDWGKQRESFELDRT